MMAWGVFLTALGLAGINFFRGHFEDSDVTMLVEQAWKFKQMGYLPSRNWGYPLYELSLYPLISTFGLTAAKFYSFVFYAATGLLFFFWFRRVTKDSLKAFLGACCFLAHPLSIISGNSIGETSQGIFLGTAALCFLFQFMEREKLPSLLLHSLFLGLAVATRQDYLFLAAAFFTALFVFKRISLLRWAAALLLFLGAALLPYILMYGPQHFSHLNTEFLQNDSFSRKWVRSLFGYLSILGLPVFFLISFWFLKNWRKFRKFPAWLMANPARFVLVAAWAFYFVRYVMLDTKQEYVSAILIPFFFFMAISLKRKSALGLVLAAVFLPNLFQIHFFRKEGRFLRPGFGVSPGVFVQERYERLKQEYIFTGPYYPTLERIAKQNFGCEKVHPYLDEAPGSDFCVIVPEERLRFWNPERWRQATDRAALFKRKIIVFPFPDHRGWRQFIEFRKWRPLEPAMFRIFTEEGTATQPSL